MKVVYVLSSTNSFGGATKSFYLMVKRLISNGIEPVIVVPDNNDFCLTLRKEGIRTIVLNFRSAIYPPAKNIREILLFVPKLIAKTVLNKIAAGKLCKEAKTFGAELIHTNVSVVDIGMKAARKLGIPHVTHIREYGDKDFNMHVFPSKSIYFRNFSTEKSYTICITKDVSKYYHLENQKNSKVIYDGVLHKSDVIKGNKKDDYFLFAGRLEEAKGISDLMKAYAKLCETRKDAFPLLVAGESTDKNYTVVLHELANSLNVSEKVRFLGNRTDILELMSKAAALIVPSRSEGFGFITAEAMFSGCIVIGRDTAGTKEQFDNGLELTGDEIGLRYQHEKELVKHLCDVMDNGIEPYLPMIERAKKTVLSLYSAEQQAENVFDFYINILEK
ncbi:MAG: glycosyltransferase family 4 protein [Bacteroidales bacterium]|nr:glycosyltransferase family 4 protein [Bacteroidales bacterium]